MTRTRSGRAVRPVDRLDRYWTTMWLCANTEAHVGCIADFAKVDPVFWVQVCTCKSKIKELFRCYVLSLRKSNRSSINYRRFSNESQELCLLISRPKTKYRRCCTCTLLIQNCRWCGIVAGLYMNCPWSWYHSLKSSRLYKYYVSMFIHWRRATIKLGEITCLNRRELGSVFSTDVCEVQSKN